MITSELVSVTTTDATPVTVPIYHIGANATVKCAAIVVARAADGTSKTWAVARTVKTVASVLSVVGTAPAAIIEGDAGASAWTIALGTSGLDVGLTLTGVAATTIRWAIQATFVING